MKILYIVTSVIIIIIITTPALVGFSIESVCQQGSSNFQDIFLSILTYFNTAVVWIV